MAAMPDNQALRPCSMSQQTACRAGMFNNGTHRRVRQWPGRLQSGHQRRVQHLRDVLLIILKWRCPPMAVRKRRNRHYLPAGNSFQNRAGPSSRLNAVLKSRP